jgi:hypothetical protein
MVNAPIPFSLLSLLDLSPSPSPFENTPKFIDQNTVAAGLVSLVTTKDSLEDRGQTSDWSCDGSALRAVRITVVISGLESRYGASSGKKFLCFPLGKLSFVCYTVL